MDDLKEEGGQTGMKLERRKVPIILQLIYTHSNLFLRRLRKGRSPFFANPNHGIIPENESMDDVGQPKPLDSDSISKLNEASLISQQFVK